MLHLSKSGTRARHSSTCSVRGLPFISTQAIDELQINLYLPFETSWPRCACLFQTFLEARALDLLYQEDFVEVLSKWVRNSGFFLEMKLGSSSVSINSASKIKTDSRHMTAIEVEDQSVPWAASGSNVTLYLVSIDPVNLSIGSVLCPPTDLVPMATSFTARIIVFDIQVPITAGASVRWSHCSGQCLRRLTGSRLSFFTIHEMYRLPP